MMRFLPLLAAFLLTNALAEPVYKCTQDGKTSYSDRPCAQGKSVELPAPVGIRPEGAESVTTRDARTLLELEKLRIAREKEQARIDKADDRQARVATTHRKQCARLNLRKRLRDHHENQRPNERGRRAIQPGPADRYGVQPADFFHVRHDVCAG